MLNTIKWEFLKWYYRLRWIMLFLILVFGAAITLTLLSNSSHPNAFTEHSLKGISFLLFAFMFLFCILLPSVNMVIDYIMPHKFMESTIARKQGTVIYAKLLINAILFYIGAAVGVLGNLVFKKVIIDGEKVFWMQGDKGMHIFLFIVLGVLVPLIVLFFYMLTYYIKTEIKHRILLMLALMTITFVGLYLLSKVAVFGKIFDVGVIIVFVLMSTNLKAMVENKYEPR